MLLNVMAIIIKQMLLRTFAMDFLIHLPTATHFDCPLCWRTMDCFPSAHLYVCMVHREFWDSSRSWDSLWNLWDMHLFKARCFTCFEGSFVICILLLPLCIVHAYTVLAIHSHYTVQQDYYNCRLLPGYRSKSLIRGYTQETSVCSVRCPANVTFQQYLCIKLWNFLGRGRYTGKYTIMHHQTLQLCHTFGSGTWVRQQSY